jgi:hypothetical protein
MTTLLQRKKELLEEIDQIGPMRRGQLSEQYYEKKNARGKTIRTGPYYVWQAWVKGKKRSIRIPKDKVETVRQEMEAHKQYKQLCEELTDVMEQLSLEPEKAADDAFKKNSMKPAG